MDHRYFPPLEDARWKHSKNGDVVVFDDDGCYLRFPFNFDSASIAMPGQDLVCPHHSPPPARRVFFIKSIGGMFRLRLRAEDQVIDIPWPTCNTLPEAFDGLCEWYDKTRAYEILSQLKADLGNHRHRLENETLAFVKDP
jgi:hypothetical protein